MRLWIDCEFNGYRGELISIALVDENGREWYEVLHQPPKLNEWIEANVIPVLGVFAPVDRSDASLHLARFLAGYDAVHIVADWPDDIRYLCELLLTGPGTRIDTPPLTFEVIRLDAPSAQPHNALADARALRALHMSTAPVHPTALSIWRLLCGAFNAGIKFAGMDRGDRLLSERADNAAEDYADQAVRSLGMRSPLTPGGRRP